MLVCGSAAAAEARLAQESAGASVEVTDEVKESVRLFGGRTARLGDEAKAGVSARDAVLLAMEMMPALPLPKTLGKWAVLKGKAALSKGVLCRRVTRCFASVSW